LNRGTRRPARLWALPVVTMTLLFAGAPITAHANESFPIDRVEFELVWERTEAPVANGDSPRSWLWGPEPRTPGMVERYLDSPGEERTVQYFDKGRMEVNDPSADPSDPWFVTSGLLTRELISGQIQIGDTDLLDTGQGASIQVAGDHLSPFPHYRDLAGVVDHGNPNRNGERADKVLTPDGLDPTITPPDDPNATFVHHVVYLGPEAIDVGYNIPRAFWDYLNAPGTVYDELGNPTVANPLFNWIYVMGFPIADPFWAEVPVRGELQWVLIQPFERRVLTYTPSNDPAWQVEMGNIGQHYRDWRRQYFPSAETGGDPGFYGLHNDSVWRYSTNWDVDEIWESAGTTDSFVPGSTLYARDEYKLHFKRTTFWAPGEDGLYLHGWDTRDGHGNLIDMIVYSPAIQVMPASWDQEPLDLVSETTAVSLNDTPRSATLTFSIVRRQLVSTSAGNFDTWHIQANDFETPNIQHLLGHSLWIEPGIGTIMWDGNYTGHLIGSSVLQEVHLSQETP
jgi:hypothetical protein